MVKIGTACLRKVLNRGIPETMLCRMLMFRWSFGPFVSWPHGGRRFWIQYFCNNSSSHRFHMFPISEDFGSQIHSRCAVWFGEPGSLNLKH